MNLIINKKTVIAIIVALAVTAFIFARLGLKTVETTHNILELTKEIVDFQNITETSTDVHDNSNKNSKPHIVYEVYAIDAFAVEYTLKYGISSQNNYVRKDGNPRPQSQLKKIAVNSQYENYEITYRIKYRNIEGRLKAKSIEQKLVTEYFYSHENQMPPFQQLPIPLELFNF